MKLSTTGAEVLAPFWSEFCSLCEYKVLLSPEINRICITTKSGDKAVGAIIRSKRSAGALVLLPDINFEPDDFEEVREGEAFWTDDATRFAARFVAAIVGLDEALHSSSDVTPEPKWASDPVYTLAIERNMRSELLEAERQVEAAQKLKEDVLGRLNVAGRLRALLYEKGKPLENAIIEALRLLGFTAANYKEAGSEFDVLFECAEGRLLGEAEGKDTKAINVGKLRQLTMNIQEDLRREEVKTPAKGVLFGNGYRLLSPCERELQFTEKCILASRASSIALLATSDLYTAVQYLSDQADDEYARSCRRTILAAIGAVVLPTPPANAAANMVSNVSN